MRRKRWPDGCMFVNSKHVGWNQEVGAFGLFNCSMMVLYRGTTINRYGCFHETGRPQVDLQPASQGHDIESSIVEAQWIPVISHVHELID